jgi:hypothetical protein
MTLTEYAPGKSRRIQLTDGIDRCSTVWVVFSARRGTDVYICPRMLGGAVKVSLHQSGSWHVGLTAESAAHVGSGESRHWDIWKRGEDLAPGALRAWYLLIPHQELRVAAHDPKAYKLPPVGPEHAAAIEFLMMSNKGPTIVFDDAHIIGRWHLEGRDESCLVVARRIAWTSEQQAGANAARQQAVAQAEAAGIPQKAEQRYYFHGYDTQGVRFGLELAATEKPA